MRSESMPDLGNLEREVMQLIWADGPLTAEVVRENLQRRLKESTVRTVLRRLEEKGYVVHAVEGRPAPPGPGPPPIPHDEIKALVESYLGSTRRVGQGIAPVRTHRFEDVLVRTRFGAPEAIFAPGIPDLVRDSESVLSGYFSFATSAPHLFGEHVEDFASEERALLASRSPENVFWDWPGDTEVILARKPD